MWFSWNLVKQYFKTDDIKISLNKMSKSIKHRGPDSQGVWVDGSCGLGFAHQRLSIIDLSDAGNQPMVSNSGRYVIAFNGEIYNHMDLRYSIKKKNIDFPWRGSSDTETLLCFYRVFWFARNFEFMCRHVCICFMG